MVRQYQRLKAKERIQWDDFHNGDLVSIEVAANFLGMSIPFLKKWGGRKIPIYKIGTATRFKIGDLREYLETCRVANN